MRREVRFSGFGGQGIILSGFIVGKAATLGAGKYATLTRSYGPESRGGACSADIVIEDGPNGYPEVEDPEVLVIMSQEAYETAKKGLNDRQMIIVDEDLVKLDPSRNDAVIKAPFTRIANELGKKLVANIVMIGFFTGATGIFEKQVILDAVLGSVPAKFKDLNVKAFERGYELGEKVSRKVAA
jgi:2-oxoglutarate ferredoxin oxidoreductase subunit gamma